MSKDVFWIIHFIVVKVQFETQKTQNWRKTQEKYYIELFLVHIPDFFFIILFFFY